MATRVSQKIHDEGGARTHMWEALDDTDLDGAGVDTPGLPFKTVSVSGTFGGATCTFQGSLDGTTWFGLLDPGGNALAFTAAGGGQVAMATPRYVRPLVSSASGTTDLDALLHASG
jgi:hypothetical protein